MKKSRKLKVYNVRDSYYRPTSTIIMKGKWLEELGFVPGAFFTAVCQEGRLVLTVTDSEDSDVW